MSMISKKICLIGDFAVGKTSLIRYFVERQFSDQYLSTIGVKISRKVVEVSSQESTVTNKVQLVIWDLEGQTKFRSYSPSYLQGAHGAIIVADLNRQETIKHIQSHIASVASVNPRDIKLIVAFNKSDLVSEETLKQQFTLNQFQDFPQVIATYMTSAKNGNNVDRMFQQLAHIII